MPISYERSDTSRLIRVTVTDPYVADDIAAVIGRQAEEQTWAYALLYDMRTVSTLPDLGDASTLLERIRAAMGSAGRRGPVGLAIAPHPERLREGLRYTPMTSGIYDLEILLTPRQVDDWLRRHGRGGES
jgi:hypothetical protein